MLTLSICRLLFSCIEYWTTELEEELCNQKKRKEERDGETRERRIKWMKLCCCGHLVLLLALLIKKVNRRGDHFQKVPDKTFSRKLSSHASHDLQFLWEEFSLLLFILWIETPLFLTLFLTHTGMFDKHLASNQNHSLTFRQRSKERIKIEWSSIPWVFLSRTKCIWVHNITKLDNSYLELSESDIYTVFSTILQETGINDVTERTGTPSASLVDNRK